MVGWQREARVKRDGEKGKTSLSTDKYKERLGKNNHLK